MFTLLLVQRRMVEHYGSPNRMRYAEKVYESGNLQRDVSVCLISKSHSTVLMQHFCHLSSRLDRPNKVFCQCALLPKVQVLVLAPTDVS